MKLTKLAVATVFAASVVSFSAMADNTGTINFVGTVVNTPCNIEQSSLKQTVDFGQLSRKALESGKPAEAELESNSLAVTLLTLVKILKVTLLR